jgi:DNA-binding helix-hairpin-helix protein with protein kinase domain
MSRPLFDSRGRTVSLANELGRGGEGSVYAVVGSSELVAKLYHSPAASEKAAKLTIMTRSRNERLQRLAAWPIETVHDRPGGLLVGFLMPRVTGFKDIHKLYSPKSRLAEYPQATWPFLLHAATNLSRAFDAIHEHGHVIGDINHGNVVVSDQAIVKLIDCDSIQVADNGHHYLCEVGVPTFTPPELQGRSFRDVIRSTNHDAFGLAVLIFHLLFMGRHPFSGRFLGAGEMPLESAIQQALFAYGANAPARQMRQPPFTLSLAAVSPSVACLFERSFGLRGRRPRAVEWIAALSELAKNLTRCRLNTNHHYLKTATICPWCEIESGTGANLFPPGSPSATVLSDFDLKAFWSQVTGIQNPGPAPSVPSAQSLQLSPSLEVLTILDERNRRRLVALGTALMVASVVAYAISDWIALWPVVGVLVTGVLTANAGSNDRREEGAKAVQLARTNLQGMVQQWTRETSGEAFNAKRKELDVLRSEYESLPARRQQKLHVLEAAQREQQLRKYLDRFRIDGTSIEGIGDGRITTLRSYGIETAADITQTQVMAVPGFGPTLTGNLLAWRRSVEKRFVFDPSRRVDPSDVARIDRDMTATQQRLEQDLRKGLSSLRLLRDQVIARRQALTGPLQEATRSLAQAVTDLQALK